ncbi:MAG: RpiB/LacA/LacB family sugar-phosphate isomerase [Spirochaetales bacterium]|nr:RpiB/LacA/LacB family sugar-phosphate isomerase [Spirochaetales bacterium]
MKIAIINETSSADKNKDILKGLEGSRHEVVNCGMKEKGGNPELQYIHTGLMAGLLLYTKRVDFVVGGCGTGQGFLNSAMQFPGVFCGHIVSPLDAWLFTQINGGNCISLALNEGYGWAGDVNLRFIFERLFSVESGCGYPLERKIPQGRSRDMLSGISQLVHKTFSEIISVLPPAVIQSVLDYPGFSEILEIPSLDDQKLKKVLTR